MKSLIIYITLLFSFGISIGQDTTLINLESTSVAENVFYQSGDYLIHIPKQETQKGAQYFGSKLSGRIHQLIEQSDTVLINVLIPEKLRSDVERFIFKGLQNGTLFVLDAKNQEPLTSLTMEKKPVATLTEQYRFFDTYAKCQVFQYRYEKFGCPPF
jgi:hypothetical protein